MTSPGAPTNQKSTPHDFHQRRCNGNAITGKVIISDEHLTVHSGHQPDVNNNETLPLTESI